MSGNVAYGLIVGATIGVFLQLVPQPLGSAMLGLLFAVHFGSRAFLTWRRTRLARATLALAIGAGLSLIAVLAAASGHTPSATPAPWPWILLLAAFAGFLMFAESILSEDRWDQYRRGTERGRLVDILLGRDIPNLGRSQRTNDGA